jgi:hypothetical protein
MKAAFLFIAVLMVGCVVSLRITGGGLLGPMLANAQTLHPMGKTTMITPGMVLSSQDGTKYTIVGGVSTDAPKGFVLDWTGPHGAYECQTSRTETDGSCRDGLRLHYVNPATGERQDALMNYPNHPIPEPAPAEEDK